LIFDYATVPIISRMRLINTLSGEEKVLGVPALAISLGRQPVYGRGNAHV
jgi:hypothetical protein